MFNVKIGLWNEPQVVKVKFAQTEIRILNVLYPEFLKKICLLPESFTGEVWILEILI
jgi:hypothetical protein